MFSHTDNDPRAQPEGSYRDDQADNIIVSSINRYANFNQQTK